MQAEQSRLEGERRRCNYLAAGEAEIRTGTGEMVGSMQGIRPAEQDATEKDCFCALSANALFPEGDGKYRTDAGVPRGAHLRG